MTISRDSLLVRGYLLLINAASSLQSVFLLAVRLYWGYQFMQAGWGKLHRMPQVIQFFANLHIPAPAANAWFVALLEFIGGILLAFGAIGANFTWDDPRKMNAGGMGCLGQIATHLRTGPSNGVHV